MAAAASTLLALVVLGLVTPIVLAVIVAITLLGLGVLAPIVTHDALQPMGRLAGVATAVLRAIQMALAGVSSALVGFMYNGQSALSMASIMAFFAIAAVAIRWKLLARS
jgi:DHA1 family bicyclomycin/chloramphenicol resistance-like MFS transporter